MNEQVIKVRDYLEVDAWPKLKDTPFKPNTECRVRGLLIGNVRVAGYLEIRQEVHALVVEIEKGVQDHQVPVHRFVPATALRAKSIPKPRPVLGNPIFKV